MTGDGPGDNVVDLAKHRIDREYEPVMPWDEPVVADAPVEIPAPARPRPRDRRYRVRPIGGDPEDPTDVRSAVTRAEVLAASGAQVAIERESEDGESWYSFTRRPIIHVEADLWPRGLAAPVAWTQGKDPRPTHFSITRDGYRAIRGEIPLPPIKQLRPTPDGGSDA